MRGKKGVQDFNFGPKKFQLRKLHLVAHAFRFSSFLSRRPCCVCSRRGMAPCLLVSDSYLKMFEELSDEQRHSCDKLLTISCLEPENIHLYMVGNQLDDEPNIYIGNGSSTKNPFKNCCFEYQVGMMRFWATLHFTFFFTETRCTLSFGSSNWVPEKYPLAK